MIRSTIGKFIAWALFGDRCGRSENKYPPVIDFGSGNTILLGGHRSGMPTILLKTSEHKLPLGEIKGNHDFSQIPTSVILTFSSKEGLTILKCAIDEFLIDYDKINAKAKEPMCFEVLISAIKDYEVENASK